MTNQSKKAKSTTRKIYRKVTRERLFDFLCFQQMLKTKFKIGGVFAGFFPFSTFRCPENVENSGIYSLYSHFQPIFQHSLPLIPLSARITNRKHQTGGFPNFFPRPDFENNGAFRMRFFT